MKKHADKCTAKKIAVNCNCDGYHTFDELYEHRTILFITLCRMVDGWVDPALESYRIWRSKKHADDTMWDGWFVMGIGKFFGHQITYHLPISKWEECKFAETLDNAPEFDGHTPDDVLERLKKL